MGSPPLVVPGVLYVGEDERARIVAHTGSAAGWHVPRGILGWSTEVSFVGRDALSEEIRRTTKLVMPEEQVPPARMPLTARAAQKSPLIAISGKLTAKLVESGIRVHTVGVDRVTSSFYYLAEGGGEDQVRVEGDLVQSVGAMLGERADNASIERVLDGLPDRLLRALSKDRLSELSVELAALLPRAAADGSGTVGVDLEAFDKVLTDLVGSGEKYAKVASEIAHKLAEASERRVEVPLFGEAKKVSQGPFDIAVGERRVSLPTYERWVMSSGLGDTIGVRAGAGDHVAVPQVAIAAATATKPTDLEDSLLASLESRSVESTAVADQRAAEAAKVKVAEEAAREAEAKEAARVAAERREAAKAAEEARQAAEAAKAAEEARQAAEAAKAAEEARHAAEAAKAAEEARKAEEAAKTAEEARKAEEAAKAAEEARKAEEAAKAAEESRKAEEAAKAAEESRKAEEAAKAAAEARKAEEAAKVAVAAKKSVAPKSKTPNGQPGDAKAKSSVAPKGATTDVQVAQKSGNLMYIVIAVALAAGVAVWRMFLK